MTPAQARAMYIRQLRQHGEMVTIRHAAGGETTGVRARLIGYDAVALAGDLQHGDRKMIALADDVPTPLELNDSVEFADGTVLNIEDVDDRTRRIGGVLIAYELRVRG